MKTYLKALNDILENGEVRKDRTGVGTKAIFGMQQRYNLREGFPILTTKKMAWKAVVSELLWFLEGSTDERRLAQILHGTKDVEKKTIWTENAEAPYWKPLAEFPGDVGLIYGHQWRRWGARVGPRIDQVADVIEAIKKNPESRRHIVTAWNPGEINQMALPPCHVLFQLYVNSNRELSCQMYQRSNDFFLGCPFNIVSYALLTHMIAQVCDLTVGELIHTTGDAHIYLNHFDQVNEQLARDPFPLPKLKMNQNVKDIDKFVMEDFELEGYQCHPSIKAPMAV